MKRKRREHKGGRERKEKRKGKEKKEMRKRNVEEGGSGFSNPSLRKRSRIVVHR